MANDRTRRTASARARDWAPRFLSALDEDHTVTEAAKLAGVGRRTAYDRREHDEEFREAWDEIVERSTERMEREAYRRAVEGFCERGIFDDEGNQIGEVRKYSDTLLTFLLKARKPDVYREHHTVKHEGAGLDGAVPLAINVDISQAAHDFLAAVRDAQR